MNNERTSLVYIPRYIAEGKHKGDGMMMMA